jgi:type II secretory pathway pseudopilin PulG
MNGNQIEGLIGMLVTLGILVLLVLPSVLGIVHDRRVDRQLREAQEARGGRRDQKSSSRSTVPSTATWYADGRRSKKFVSS